MSVTSLLRGSYNLETRDTLGEALECVLTEGWKSLPLIGFVRSSVKMGVNNTLLF